MKSPRLLVLSLAILALTLGTAACGGASSAKKAESAKAEVRIEARWRAGLVQWRDTTQKALNEISLIFATAGSLNSLASFHSAVSHRLASDTQTLSSCSATVHRLGPVPVAFTTSDGYAAAACKNLEQGEHLIAATLTRLRRNQAVDTLNPIPGAGSLLSTGQNEVIAAGRALGGHYG